MAKFNWTVGWQNSPETFTFEATFGPKRESRESCAHPEGRQDWKSVTCQVSITHVVSDKQGAIPGTFIAHGRVTAQQKFWEMDIPDEDTALAQMAFCSLLGTDIPCVAGVYA